MEDEDSESDRPEAIIDERQGTIWALFPRHSSCRFRQILFVLIFT